MALTLNRLKKSDGINGADFHLSQSLTRERRTNGTRLLLVFLGSIFGSGRYVNLLLL